MVSYSAVGYLVLHQPGSYMRIALEDTRSKGSQGRSWQMPASGLRDSYCCGLFSWGTYRWSPEVVHFMRRRVWGRSLLQHPRR
jgi:hypothetical protein